MSNAYVKPPYEIAEYLPEKGWSVIETVERGNDLPEQGWAVGIIYDAPSQPTAEFVVRACNAHASLVAACRAALRESAGNVALCRLLAGALDRAEDVG